MLIESSKLDMIGPKFDAALQVCSSEGECMAEVPVRVMPGPISSVNLHCSPKLERNLRPGIVVEKIELELLDAFGNHIEEGVQLSVDVDGFCFQDNIGSVRKVNDQGCVDLGGLLKVTAGYGCRARLIVSVGDKVVFEKLFQVAKRELKALSGVPEYCQAGSHITNIIFGMVDSDGVIDETVHGHCHTLTITSDILAIDGTVQYVFKHGKCTVPAIPIPERQGTFQFSAYYTDSPNIRTSIEVCVNQAPKLELDQDGDIFQSQQSNGGKSPLQNSSPISPCQLEFWMETITDDMRKLDEQSAGYGRLVGEHESKIKKLYNKKGIIEKEIDSLQGSLEPQYLTQTDSLVNSNEQVAKRIEGKGDSAAAVLCKLSKAIQLRDQQIQFMTGIVGVVALLGTVSNNKLSSIFAEYVGEKYMLAIVCKSYDAATALEKYGESGQVDHNYALHEVAANQHITIKRRFPVICLEEIRPYRGALIKNGPQKLLALPNPLLPSGKVPDGFLGYAVNMINLDNHHINTEAAADHRLRETLFYRLFGEVQVYETREQMKQAKACIKHGAVSLDGGIMKDNGILLLGDCEPEIRFPVSSPEVEKGISMHWISILEDIEKKKALLLLTCEQIERETEAHSKALSKFHKKKDKLQMLMQKSPLHRLEYSQTKTSRSSQLFK